LSYRVVGRRTEWSVQVSRVIVVDVIGDDTLSGFNASDAVTVSYINIESVIVVIVDYRCS
jgi:hypothetical protein